MLPFGRPATSELPGDEELKSALRAWHISNRLCLSITLEYGQSGSKDHDRMILGGRCPDGQLFSHNSHTHSSRPMNEPYMTIST